MTPPAAPVPTAPRTARRAAVLRWGPAVLWAALIFALSSISKLPSPPGLITDKHMHLVVYAVLAAAIVWGLTDRAPARTTSRGAALAAALAALYGVSDELHQAFVPGRELSALDLVADALGAIVGAGGLRAWAIIRARR